MSEDKMRMVPTKLPQNVRSIADRLTTGLDPKSTESVQKRLGGTFKKIERIEQDNEKK